MRSLPVLFLAILFMAPTTVYAAGVFSIDQASPEYPGAASSASVLTRIGSPPVYPPSWLGMSATDELEAFSFGRDAVTPAAAGSWVNFFYSVTRSTVGVAGGAVNTQAATNGAAGDVFQVSVHSAGPAGVPVLRQDAARFGLTVLPAPQSGLDAFDGNRGVDAYFCAGPVASGWNPADIYYVAAPGPGPVTVATYATRVQLGLVATDKIDAVAILDAGTRGVLNAGDVVYVSLTPASPTLAALGATAASIIQVYPGPAVVVFTPPQLGLLLSDDVDAMSAFDPSIYDKDSRLITPERQDMPTGPTFLLRQYVFETGPACDYMGWTSHDATRSYGDFAMLYPGLTVVQESWTDNLTCLWAFLNGSTASYACGGWPAQTAVPYGNARDEYIANEVWSPVIPLAGAGSGLWLKFDTYRDLRLSDCVFYGVRVRSSVGAIPGPWRSDGRMYFGDPTDWFAHWISIGALVEPGATDIQVALGVVDMCGLWGGMTGFCDCACHSHAPLFDNVELYRENGPEPAWIVRDIDLFQDTFPADGTLNGIARADAANDIKSRDNASIQRGDSSVVTCGDLVWGLAPDAYTGYGPAVYGYVSVLPPGRVSGPDLVEPDPYNVPPGVLRWPVVDSVTIATRLWETEPTPRSLKWYIVRLDTCFLDRYRRVPAPDKFCLDLNDNLFAGGDTVLFFYGAGNNNGQHSFFSEFTGVVDLVDEAARLPMEFQVLPGEGYYNGGDILYVDDSDEFDARRMFETAYVTMNLLEMVDRYDVRGAASCEGNSPGGTAVTDIAQQLVAPYRKIIWNSGSLRSGTIGDGTGSPEKADDLGLLTAFLDQLPVEGGLYISGDNVAEEYAARPFLINYNLISPNHTLSLRSHGLSPTTVGLPGSMFGPPAVLTVDTMIAYGGYPIRRDFDVMEPTVSATAEMTYDDTRDPLDCSVIAEAKVNGNGITVGVVLSGFSYHNIRDDRPAGIPDRAYHLQHVLFWLSNAVPDPVGIDDPPRHENRLDQNYPNPFNPVTRIHYSVRESGNVTLIIYDVAGRRVKTLVDEVRIPAENGYSVEWRGTNDSGSPVASGVYFCKMTAGGYTQTRKLVLMK